MTKHSQSSCAALCPSDEDVQDAIFSALNKLEADEVRPNKLRKIVCRNVEGASWTQFQKNMDSLIERGELQAGEGGGGERVILVTFSLKGKRQQTVGKGGTEGFGESEKAKVAKKSIDVRIPRAIALHLTRKSHLKQKNIENNTKTKLSLAGKELNKKNISDDKDDVDGEIMLTISREIIPDNKVRRDEVEPTAAIDRQLNAASVMINKMVDAYKKNPDHFTRKVGGSFREQAEEKRKRQDALECRLSKKMRPSGKNEASNGRRGVRGSDKLLKPGNSFADVDSTAKKSKRYKFY